MQVAKLKNQTSWIDTVKSLLTLKIRQQRGIKGTPEPLLCEEVAKELFWRAFGSSRGSDETSDDLIFFIPATDDPSAIQVYRHDPDKQPAPPGPVNWQATLLVNFLCQVRYLLRISACYYYQGRLVVKSEVTKPVFASPVESVVGGHRKASLDEAMHGKSSKYSYPLVYFSIDDFESCFEDVQVTSDEVFVVELVAVFDASGVELARLVTKLGHYYEKLTSSDVIVPIFQGAVTYDAFLKAHQATHLQVVNFLGVHEVKGNGFLMMTGPFGIGEAQVHLIDLKNPKIQHPQSSPMSPRPHRRKGSLSALKDFVSNLSVEFFGSDGESDLHLSENNELDTKVTDGLACRLTFIRLHWLEVIKCLFPIESAQC